MAEETPAPAAAAPAAATAPTIELSWEKITLSIEVGPKKARTTKYILNGISGEALPGEMLAVMGPSGSGKTSLLNALARRNDAFEGSLRMNGVDMRGQGLVLNSSTAYMHQDERFLPELTVREHLLFQARLRMRADAAERERRVDAVMMELGLDKIASQLIGDQHGQAGHHISRNERKRLSFASELLTGPALLFVDEPTTGLDSYMAESVVTTLKGLASGPRRCTVVATIHQPASDVYRLFDKVCFLVGGRVGYFGELAGLVPFLTGLGYPPPMHCCPADHVMRLFVNPEDPAGSEERRSRIVEAFAAQEKEKPQKQQPEEGPGRAQGQLLEEMRKADRESDRSHSFCSQVCVLISREFVLRRRSTQAFKARMLQTVLFGTWFGLTYLRVDITQFSIFTVSGALFFCMMMLLFGGPMTVAQVVPSQLPVYIRERRCGSYKIAAMYVAKMVADVPTELIFTFIWSLITYWMIGFRGSRVGASFATELQDYFAFWGELWLLSYCAFGFGYFAAFASPPNVPEVGFLLTLLLILPQMIFGGFFINLSVIPSWLHWIRDLCMLRYGFSLVNIVQWDDYGPVPCDASFCPFSPSGTGEDIRRQLVGEDALYVDIIAIVVISLIFRLLALAMLVRRAKPAVFDSAAPDAGTLTLQADNGEQDESGAAETAEGGGTPIVLEWNKVTFAPAGRTVLDQVSGSARPGRLLVVMGPSGSGKTCLLNAITGRNRNITGEVKFNGAPWTDSLASQVAYMHQEDMFLPDLTVREHLMFASMLKTSGAVPRAQRSKRIDDVIVQLGLASCQNTLIGNIGAGISGGERKRLALAAEILSNPSLLVVDEPTSGLDSAMAESVIQLLDGLAKGKGGAPPRTVIATIHQPSRDVFLRFTDLMMLADGQVAYHGEAAAAVGYFGEMGHPCPADMNPPEHFMRLVSHHLGADMARREESERRVSQITGKHTQRLEASEGAVQAAEPTAPTPKLQTYHISIVRQMTVLYRRETLLRRRSKLLFKALIGRTVILTILVGFVWFQLPNDGRLPIIQSFMGVLTFVMINQFMGSGAGLVQSLPLIMPAIMRDHYNGLHSVTAWYFSKVLADLPFETVFPSVFMTGVFWLVGFGNLVSTASEAVEMWLLMVALAVATGQMGNAFALVCSALAKEPPTAFAFFSGLVFPWIFYSGMMINYEDIPVYFVWLHWTSPFKFIYTSLAVTIFENADSLACPAGAVCPYESGPGVLKQFSIDPKDRRGAVVAIVALLVIFRVLAWALFVFASKRRAPAKVAKVKAKADAIAVGDGATNAATGAGKEEVV